MNKILAVTAGYKTYITVAVGLGLGVAQALGYPIPIWVDSMAAFLGIGFQRLAIQNQTVQTTRDVSALLQTILASVEQTQDKK